MEIGKINQLISGFNKQKIESKSKIKGGIEKPGIFDKVDISSDAGKTEAVARAQDAMLELKSSLVDTLAIDGITTKNKGFYNLIDTPMDKFVQNSFTELTPDAKKEFMDIFSSLSQTSGGLATESLIKQTFGDSGGFGEMITQITQQLNKYLPSPRF